MTYVGMQHVSEALWCTMGRHSRSVGCDHALTCAVKVHESINSVLIQDFLKISVMPPLTKFRPEGKRVLPIPAKPTFRAKTFGFKLKIDLCHRAHTCICRTFFQIIRQIILFSPHFQANTNFLMLNPQKFQNKTAHKLKYNPFVHVH